MRATRRGAGRTRATLAGIVGLGLGALTGCGGDDGGNPARRELREFDLTTLPVETVAPSLFERSAPALHDVLAAIDAARTDTHVVSLFVHLGPLGGGYGRIQDLREAFQAVREAQKPIHCHFETIDNAGFELANRICDRITMTPAGSLDAVGVAAQLIHVRALLAELGVRADILHVGAFKGAGEPFTRDEPSPEMLEAMNALLDDMAVGLTSSIAEHRAIAPERAQELIDAAPHDSASARAAGLVDAVEFDDEARTRAREAGNATRNVRAVLTPPEPPPTLGDILGALSGAREEETVTGRRIVVAHVDGQIVSGDEPVLGSAADGPFITEMRELASDEDVVAVVVRIDSPGGSALASDRMWHAMRRVANAKPLIVSVGDVAASGGYYIASGGHEIFAHRASIVGSIGVVGGKVEISSLMSEHGVRVETLRRGANASWTTLTAAFSETERAAIMRLMTTTYDRFVDRVAMSRHLDRAEVLRSAEGRVWSGADGIERHLVDHEGGLRAAIARARERATVGEDIPVVEWPSRRTLLDVIAASMSEGQDEQAAVAALAARAPIVREVHSFATLLDGDEHVLCVMPPLFDIR